MWKDRFTESIRTYRSAQLQVIKNLDHVPGIAEYLELLPDLSGIKIVLDFIEPAEGLDIEGKATEDVDRLRQHAVNIIAWTVVCTFLDFFFWLLTRTCRTLSGTT